MVYSFLREERREVTWFSFPEREERRSNLVYSFLREEVICGYSFLREKRGEK